MRGRTGDTVYLHGSLEKEARNDLAINAKGTNCAPFPTDLVAFRHPVNEGDWKHYITGFRELTDFVSTTREAVSTIAEIAEPVLKSTMNLDPEILDECPAQWVLPVTMRIFIHLYCLPNNQGLLWLQGKRGLTLRELRDEGSANDVLRLLEQLGSNQEFLSLYLYCEENQISVSHQIRSLRNRLLHRFDRQGQSTKRPHAEEIYKANLRLRKSIHSHSRGLIQSMVIDGRPVQVICQTCQNQSKKPDK